MKREPLFLVAFLMCLYLTPPLFMASYAGIAAPQNTPKEFVVADSWVETGEVSVGFDLPEWIEAGTVAVEFDTFPYGSNPSNQSIEGFSETLPDDVLHYPDALTNNTEIYASGGQTLSLSYTDTWTIDGQAPLMLETDGDHLDFEGPSLSITTTYLLYNFYLTSISDPTVDISIYNYTSSIYDELVSDIGDTVPQWYRGSVAISLTDHVNETGHIKLAVEESVEEVNIDCAYVQFEYMTGSGYAESFSDVSDWNAHANFAGANDAITTDGDVLVMECEWNGGQDYDYIYFDVDSFDTTDNTYYIEFALKVSRADVGDVWIRIAGADIIGSPIQDTNPAWSTTWKSFKYLVDSSTVPTIESIGVCTWDESADFVVYVDYIRIGPSDEMGWQHDGSTTDVLDVPAQGDWTIDSSSDGDILTIDWNRTGAGGDNFGNIYLYADNTATKANIESSDYPFFKLRWRVTSFEDNGGTSYVWIVPKYDELAPASGAESPYAGSTEDWHTEYFNSLAFSGSTAATYAYLDIMFRADAQYASCTIEIDYTGFYSIANYTISESSTTTHDYLYVSEGTLYSNMDTGIITLDYDVPLNLEWPYYGWGLNSSLGQPQVDFYNASSGWLGYSSESEGQLPYNCSITDVRFRFSDSGNITSLTFFDSSGWRDIGLTVVLFRIKSWISAVIVIIRFVTEAFSKFYFAGFFILAGLIMIPTSTIFLVRGGRSEMSNDKLFLFLMIFLFGWAFFLGGIL